MKENISVDDYITDILQRCLNVPALAFGANTVEPYKELQYITQTASYICYLYNMYKINKRNLKEYKDDRETLEEIKRRMSEYLEKIQEKCKELEEFYNQREKEGWN